MAGQVLAISLQCLAFCCCLALPAWDRTPHAGIDATGQSSAIFEPRGTPRLTWISPSRRSCCRADDGFAVHDGLGCVVEGL